MECLDSLKTLIFLGNFVFLGKINFARPGTDLYVAVSCKTVFKI